MLDHRKVRLSQKSEIRKMDGDQGGVIFEEKYWELASCHLISRSLVTMQAAIAVVSDLCRLCMVLIWALSI